METESILQILKHVQELSWNPFVFFVLYLAFSFTPIPLLALNLCGGILFGFFPGIFYNLIAANLSASAVFFVARLIGKDLLKKLFLSQWLVFEERVAKSGFKGLILLRFVPLLPTFGVSFCAGLSPMRYKTYALATLMGTFPETILFTYCADILTRLL